MIFLNVHTLRLSVYGRNLFIERFDSWRFDSPGLHAKNLITLNRHMRYPYYIDKKDLVLFTERDAFMVKITDATTWIQGKTNEN